MLIRSRNTRLRKSFRRDVLFLAGLFTATLLFAPGSGRAQTNAVQHSSAKVVAKHGKSEPAGKPLLPNGTFEAEQLSGWTMIQEGGGEGEIARDSSVPLNETNLHSLRLTVTNPGTRCGVINTPGPGIAVQSGNWYDLTFHARSEKRENDRGFGLTVSLESQNGEKVCARATIPEVGGVEWKPYTLALDAYHSDPKARVVITMSEPGDVVLTRRNASASAQANEN
jgi:hypothetical protein